MARPLPPAASRCEAVIIIRAFDYHGIEDSIQLESGTVTYVEYVMSPVSRGARSAVLGVVLDDFDRPVQDAIVQLTFPMAYLPVSGKDGFSTPAKLVLTGDDGQFAFNDIGPGDYRLAASKRGMATDHYPMELQPGQREHVNLFLTPDRRLSVVYAYQPDGTTSFEGPGVVHGELEWIHGTGGIDFSESRIEQCDPKSLRDLEFTQREGQLSFRIFYHGPLRNGFYDAGPVRFESVAEATNSGYARNYQPCVKGHVYIVRTYEGYYAKMLVRDIR